MLLVLAIGCAPACGSSAPTPPSSAEGPSIPLVALFDDAVLYGISRDGRVFGGEHLRTPEPRLDGARSVTGHAGFSLLGSPPDHYECASLSSGDVVCRGSNANGDLTPIATSTCDNPEAACPQGESDCFRFGPKTYPCVPDWTPLPGVRDLAQIHETCGVDSHDDLTCWGHGQQEILPLPRPVKRLAGRFAIFDDGTLFDRQAHAVVPGLTNVVDASGDYTSCALEGDGSLSCWGSNVLAMVGDGTTMDRKDPVKVGAGFASVRVGFGGACGAMTDGGLSCWGTAGASANVPVIACGGGGTCVATPTRVAGVAGVVQLASADMASAIVLTSDGRVLQLSSVFANPIVATIVHP